MKTKTKKDIKEYNGLLDKIKDPYLLNYYSETLIKVINEKIKKEKLNLE